jgi:hypothetical protein
MALLATLAKKLFPQSVQPRLEGESDTESRGYGLQEFTAKFPDISGKIVEIVMDTVSRSNQDVANRGPIHGELMPILSFLEHLDSGNTVFPGTMNPPSMQVWVQLLEPLIRSPLEPVRRAAARCLAQFTPDDFIPTICFRWFAALETWFSEGEPVEIDTHKTIARLEAVGFCFFFVDKLLACGDEGCGMEVSDPRDDFRRSIVEEYSEQRGFFRLLAPNTNGPPPLKLVTWNDVHGCLAFLLRLLTQPRFAKIRAFEKREGPERTELFPTLLGNAYVLLLCVGESWGAFDDCSQPRRENAAPAMVTTELIKVRNSVSFNHGL